MCSFYADRNGVKMVKQYSGFKPKAQRSIRQQINDYVHSIPFSVRLESRRDRELRYTTFKRWMTEDLKVDSCADYEYGIKRITDKLLI